MPVRSTYSSRDALGSILSAINSLSTSITGGATLTDVKDALEESHTELKRIRRGQELVVGQEIEILEDEDD